MKGGTFVCSELGQGMTGCYVECCFGVMYVDWYGVCNCVVFSVVEICVDYGGVYVFHVCFDLWVVNGVGICVDVCSLVCVVECICFLSLGVACCLIM